MSAMTPRTHSLTNRLSGKLACAKRNLDPGPGKRIYHSRGVANRKDASSRERPLSE
jgi:hypothetical protein